VLPAWWLENNRCVLQFSNLCGTVYGGGNVVFGLDGDTLLSPVGNRVTVFDLVKGSCRTLPCQSRSNISNLVLSPDGGLLVTVDTEGHALFINYHSSSVLHHFNFKGKVPQCDCSPTATAPPAASAVEPGTESKPHA
jgi:periodic tryptophan protein 2